MFSLNFLLQLVKEEEEFFRACRLHVRPVVLVHRVRAVLPACQARPALGVARVVVLDPHMGEVGEKLLVDVHQRGLCQWVQL